ncbi:MAG: transporter ATP-binding protein [Rariglobus sp.]|jgi:capsular polysaccharide transport system ATP-binding protein|nr:transporter ATP-binding protein [Rariglobus sp.]
MIKISHLDKAYRLGNGRLHPVFQDASVTIPPDVNVAILGANGAGKSTLLRLLAGVDQPDGGRIASTGSLSWPVTLRGGFLPVMSGRENCWVVFSIHGYSREAIREKLAKVHEISGIGEYFDEPVKNYSAGMRVRLGFALCMAFDYDYFLLDEITSVGDAGFRDTCKTWLRARNQKHNIILVSHQMNTIRQFCQVAVVVQDHKLTLVEDIEEAIAPFADD